MKQLCEKTCALVKEVGAYIQGQRTHFSEANIETKSINQLVSYVDQTAEKKLVNGLSLLFPDAGFITEEQTIATETKEWMWVIDPLDGTTNFMHGIPVYSISIGLLHNNKPVMGIVYELNQNELFYAWEGSPAYLNGSIIQVRSETKFANTLLATGLPYYDFEGMQPYLSTLTHLMKETRGIRRMGSAAVDLAYVACGRFDGYFEYGLSPWDVAGGIFIVQQAGGVITNFDGGEDAVFSRSIVAASAALHQQLASVIQTYF
ncbi:MAG: inositol monophosphatase [Bacteroidia bacterium]|jgi:myo-inositol-1(or 4)-monophosphatase|nr:inositol monophosphatase [Bacteroidia bacterium]